MSDSMRASWCNFSILSFKLFPHKEPYAAVLLLLSPITVLLNLGLIVSFIATRQVTKNASNILIFSSSFCDLITAAVSMPLASSILLNMKGTDFCIKSMVLFVLSGIPHLSVALTVLLAMDRYLHMNTDIQGNPSKLKRMLKKQNICYLILVGFIVLISTFTIAALHINRMLTMTITAFFTILLTIYEVVVACLYIRGYLRIRRFVDNNPVYNEPGGSTRTTPDYVRKLYKTVLILIILAFVQYVPLSVIHTFAIAFDYEQGANKHQFLVMAFEAAHLASNAVLPLNCLVILHFNNEAKTWILRKVGLRKISGQAR